MSLPQPFKPKFPKVYADDLKRFGQLTAVYNQGFLAGDDNGFERATKAIRRHHEQHKLNRAARVEKAGKKR